MQVSATEAAELVREGKATLVDVRTREEFDAVHIEGATFFSQDLMQKVPAMAAEKTVIFMCHHGIRSLDAAAYFVGHGVENVRSLQGGIDAWSCEVDPALPRYDLA